MTYLGTPYFSPILPKHLYEGTDVVKNDYNSKPVEPDRSCSKDGGAVSTSS
jgi:hypothetical protein